MMSFIHILKKKVSDSFQDILANHFFCVCLYFLYYVHKGPWKRYFGPISVVIKLRVIRQIKKQLGNSASQYYAFVYYLLSLALRHRKMRKSCRNPVSRKTPIRHNLVMCLQLYPSVSGGRLFHKYIFRRSLSRNDENRCIFQFSPNPFCFFSKNFY